MTKPIPGKAVVKCKFMVEATLEVDIEDVTMSDRSIADAISYQGLFECKHIPETPYFNESTFGFNPHTLSRLGIVVLEADACPDP